MREFILGIITSLTSSAIILGVGWLASRTLRQWLVVALARITGVGVVRLYRTQQEANRDLAGDLANARWVRVLAGRGNELTRDSFTAVWPEVGGRLEAVEILLPDPECGTESWLERREDENARHDKGYTSDLLADQVRGNIEYVLNIADHNPGIILRLYNLPNVCRIVATDEVVYFTPYSAAVHGRNSPCLVFRKHSSMYEFALRVFSTAWDSARLPAKEEGSH